MKALILTAALPLLACAVRAQDAPHAHDAPAETVEKAHAAAWLGIVMTESDDKVVVGQVIPGSPADKAGLKEGDRILRIGDAAVEGQMERVRDKVGQQKPGGTIEVRYLRGDKEDTVKVELAERPAELGGDFRGEFRREEKKISPAPGWKTDDQGRILEETKPAIEDVKEEIGKNADRLRFEYGKAKKRMLTPDGDKKKPAPDIELDPFKEADGGKLLRYYFDKEWRGNKDDDDDWELRLGMEAPLFEWKNGQKPGVKFLELKKRGSPENEAAIWKRVQESIARSLKQSDVGPDMVGKVMKAVEEARRADTEKDARRTKLEAEAAKLEKEMQSIKERSEKVREELKKATE